MAGVYLQDKDSRTHRNRSLTLKLRYASCKAYYCEIVALFYLRNYNRKGPTCYTHLTLASSE